MSSLRQSFRHLAPELPDYQAQYRAIQFEPVALSGERLTIGIMAKSLSGETRVIQTLASRTIRCMFGEKHKQMNNLIAMILDAASRHLEMDGDIAAWKPPVTGVTLTDIQTTYSNKGMEGILFQAITHHASLYRGDIVNNALSEWQQDEDQESETEAEQRLITRVKSLVTQSNQNLAGNWNKPIHAINGTLLQIDYLGLRYNANFANFDVKQIKLAYRFAKAKLLDLELLRNKRQQETISTPQDFELLINVSATSTPEQQDLLEGITQAADEQELLVISETTPDKLAKRILTREAA